MLTADGTNARGMHSHLVSSPMFGIPAIFLPHNFLRGFIVTLAENVNLSFDTRPQACAILNIRELKRATAAHISAFSPLFFPRVFRPRPPTLPYLVGDFSFLLAVAVFTRFCIFTRRGCVPFRRSRARLSRRRSAC